MAQPPWRMYAPVYRIYDNNRDITPTRWRQGALLKVSRRWRRGGVHRLLHAIEQTQRQGQKEGQLGVEVVHVDDLPVEVRLGDRPS